MKHNIGRVFRLVILLSVGVAMTGCCGWPYGWGHGGHGGGHERYSDYGSRR